MTDQGGGSMKGTGSSESHECSLDDSQATTDLIQKLSLDQKEEEDAQEDHRFHSTTTNCQTSPSAYSAQDCEIITQSVLSSECREKVQSILSLVRSPNLAHLLSSSLGKKLNLLTRAELATPQDRTRALKLCTSIGTRILTEFLAKMTRNSHQNM